MKDFVEFVQNLYGTNSFIPLHEPRFSGNELAYVNDCIESTFVSSVGEYVNRFEREIANYSEADHAVAIVNGTAALQVALRLVGVSSGDEVITQALTFVATANAIHYNGAKPVFVDVDLDTMGLSPEYLKAFLEEYGDRRDQGTFNKLTGKRIAACVPMHTFGFMCRIDEILDICDNWGIPVVEDAAEALGSRFKDQRPGTFGKVGTLSFNGNKIITAGGGGAIVTNDEKLAREAKYLTTTAKVSHKWNYEHDQVGYNYRMPNLNAALVCAQLEQLEKFRSSKSEVFSAYQAFFEGASIELMLPPENTEWNHWLIAVKCEDRTQRDRFLSESNEGGVMTRPIWHLMYRLPMYSECQRDEQKNAEYLEERIVNIPSSTKR